MNELDLQEIIENSSSAFIVYKAINCGEDFEFVFINTKALEIINAKKEEVIGSTLLTELPNAKDATFFRALQDVYKEGGTRDLSNYYYKDKKREGFRRNRVYKLDNGNIVANFFDTSDVIKKEVFLQGILDTEKNLIILSEDGEKIEECNQAFLDFFHYNSLESFQKDHKCICERFVKDSNNSYIGTTVGGVKWIDYVMANQGSHTIKAKLFNSKKEEFVFSVTAKRVEYPQKNEYIVILHDITEAEKDSINKDKNLEDTIRLLENAETKARIGSWYIDIIKDRVTFSKELKRMFNIKEQGCEFSNDYMMQYVEPDYRKLFLESVRESLKSGVFYAITRILTDKGAKRLEANGTVEYDGNNKPIGISGYSKDITDQEKIRELEHDKQWLENDMNKFFAIQDTIKALAHHWRQPLNAINMTLYNLQEYLEVVDISQPRKEQIVEELQLGEKSLQFLSKTLDSFQSVVKNNYQKTNVNICELLPKIVSFIQEKLDANKITIEINCKSFTIVGSSEELQRIIISILENSVEAIEKKKKDRPNHKGHITVRGKKGELIIADNGSGMSSAVLEKAFDPYFTTKFMSRGVGLSLYSCKRTLITDYNAKINFLHSSQEGSELLIKFR